MEHEAEAEVCGVAKYKTFWWFKKQLTKLGNNSFAFGYEVAIA